MRLDRMSAQVGKSRCALIRELLAFADPEVDELREQLQHASIADALTRLSALEASTLRLERTLREMRIERDSQEFRASQTLAESAA